MSDIKLIIGLFSLFLIGLLYLAPWLSYKASLIKNDTKYPYWLRKRL